MHLVHASFLTLCSLKLFHLLLALLRFAVSPCFNALALIEHKVSQRVNINAFCFHSPSGLTGVMLYINENLSMIQADNPDVNGVEARKIAIKLFRSLGAEEKQVRV